MRAVVAALTPALFAAHGGDLPVNAELGVPGFPNCRRKNPHAEMNVEEAALDLECEQVGAATDAIKIACVGDSITAGVHSTGGNHTYPGQLQILLDEAHGTGTYQVTNLGACGSTLLKKSNSPYWERPQYKTLTTKKWDIVVIMLGTNDAKDIGDGGPDNWQHDCGGVEQTTTTGCSYAADYKAMVDIVRTVGTTAAGPKIYGMIPAPLMAPRSIGANQTVINSVYPKLVPMIVKENNILGPINVFSGMGGVSDWEEKFPPKCVINSTWEPCGWWCDEQSCNQCHPNNDGYHNMATVVQAGLGLTSSVVV